MIVYHQCVSVCFQCVKADQVLAEIKMFLTERDIIQSSRRRGRLSGSKRVEQSIRRLMRNYERTVWQETPAVCSPSGTTADPADKRVDNTYVSYDSYWTDAPQQVCLQTELLWAKICTTQHHWHPPHFVCHLWNVYLTYVQDGGAVVNTVASQ